jgi:hypothetical protein
MDILGENNEINENNTNNYVVIKTRKKKNKRRLSINNFDLDELLSREKLPISKKRYKVDEKTFKIPNYDEYDKFIEVNYYIPQLKVICKHFSLKQNGNKNELMTRIYNFLYYSKFAIVIQRNMRHSLLKKYKKLKGEALFTRNKCVNDSDFYSLDPVEEIPINQFISICEEGKHYGFDICSLYNLFHKNKLKFKDVKINNPYTRQEFPKRIFLNIKRIKRIGKLLNLPVELKIEEESNYEDKEFQFSQRVFKVFQLMDTLGNYTDINWFTSLDFNSNVKFFREIQDIWNYRSQLSNEKKREICPPFGNPFYNLNIDVNNVHLLSLEKIKKVNCHLMEELIYTSNNEQSKSLGVWIVLTGLTLVNNAAAIALPWLFESVS